MKASLQSHSFTHYKASEVRRIICSPVHAIARGQYHRCPEMLLIVHPIPQGNRTFHGMSTSPSYRCKCVLLSIPFCGPMGWPPVPLKHAPTVHYASSQRTLSSQVSTRVRCEYSIRSATHFDKPTERSKGRVMLSLICKKG